MLNLDAYCDLVQEVILTLITTQILTTRFILSGIESLTALDTFITKTKRISISFIRKLAKKRKIDGTFVHTDPVCRIEIQEVSNVL